MKQGSQVIGHSAERPERDLSVFFHYILMIQFMFITDGDLYFRTALFVEKDDWTSTPAKFYERLLYWNASFRTNLMLTQMSHGTCYVKNNEDHVSVARRLDEFCTINSRIAIKMRFSSDLSE